MGASMQVSSPRYTITNGITNEEIRDMNTTAIGAFDEQLTTVKKAQTKTLWTYHKVVHRDVAARNILLFERNVVKISDFGLARRVGQCDVYERTRKGLLPVRWMSPETLLYNQFSEKSDVWSFGVLLWEMVTLGSTPYSEFDFDQVVEKIKGRELLTCPYNAEGMIKPLMMSCWHSSADDRPTFSKLCKQIERLLEENSDYIDLDVPDDHEYSTVT